jgi:hypothetical protein
MKSSRLYYLLPLRKNAKRDSCFIDLIMPFTPYYFGPNGFVGLVFKKLLDLPVFILSNIIIDFEVLFHIGRFPKVIYL